MRKLLITLTSLALLTACGAGKTSSSNSPPSSSFNLPMDGTYSYSDQNGQALMLIKAGEIKEAVYNRYDNFNYIFEHIKNYPNSKVCASGDVLVGGYHRTIYLNNCSSTDNSLDFDIGKNHYHFIQARITK